MKQFVGKAEMDSENTPEKRRNHDLREGRLNNEPKDRGKHQREERDDGVKQQITCAAAATAA